MPRTKGKRYYNGVLFEENLYDDPRKRPTFWRYVQPDGGERIFKAPDIHEANRLAKEANGLRDSVEKLPDKKLSRSSLAYWVGQHIILREKERPSLKTKQSWTNRCYALKNFAKSNPDPYKLSFQSIETWWRSLTHSQQILRQAEFRKLFGFLMSRRVVPQLEYNPFTTQDDRPRLYVREETPSERLRLDVDGFWPIYEKAREKGYDGLQIAMGLSLYTSMRRGDVSMLRADLHVNDGFLRRTINKSEEKRGEKKGERLEWRLDDHPPLAGLVERGIRLGEKNKGFFRDDFGIEHDKAPCPFLVSHKPDQKRLGTSKTHVCQMLGRRIADQFVECRDATELWANEEHGPTYHEIRSLGLALYTRAGYQKEQIKTVSAHSAIAMIDRYNDGHKLPHKRVELTLSQPQLGGAF